MRPHPGLAAPALLPATGWLGRLLAVRAGLAATLLVATLAAGASVGLQGFYFGVVNNSYHIPIVDGWLGDPQFAGDGYVQSLRFHTSYVWPLAAVLARWLGTYDTFLLLHVANRIAMLAGMALLLRELGVRTLVGLSACVAALGITRYLLAASGPGEHDLFMPFLNHSSLTWPFIFASWLLLLRGRVALSLALQGPVFAVNAFVAICGAPAVLAGACAGWPAGWAARRALVGRIAAGGGLALLIAAPTVVWIAHSFTEQPAGAPFSFLGFLHEYFLKHWYLTAASPRRLVSFVLVAGCGLASLRRLGPGARALLPVWWGYLAVFAAGVALPYLADSRTLLVLHPMRVGAGCLVMLSVIVTVAYLGRALEAVPPWSAIVAAVGLAGFAAGQAGLLLTALATGVVAAPRRAGAPSGADSLGIGRAARGTPFPGAVALLATWLAVVAAWRANEPPPYDLAALAAGRDAGLWIAANTRPGSMLFIPSGAADGEDDPVSVWARRPLWYDWKEGAAVMWTPGYHAEWSARRRETARLRTAADDVAYACAHGIDILVEAPSRLGPDMAAATAYSNGQFAVLRTASLCAAGPNGSGLLLTGKSK